MEVSSPCHQDVYEWLAFVKWYVKKWMLSQKEKKLHFFNSLVQTTFSVNFHREKKAFF